MPDGVLLRSAPEIVLVDVLNCLLREVSRASHAANNPTVCYISFMVPTHSAGSHSPPHDGDVRG